MTTTSNQVQEWYSQLLAVNQETFDAGLFDAAYHALRAAMHCAELIEGDSSLSRVGSLAVEQNEQIDLFHSDYAHSTASARKLGQTYSIYTAISNEVRALLEIRKVQRQQKPPLS